MTPQTPPLGLLVDGFGGGGWHKASVSEKPIGLSPLLILTLCGPERVLVVSTDFGGGRLDLPTHEITQICFQVDIVSQERLSSSSSLPTVRTFSI